MFGKEGELSVKISVRIVYIEMHNMTCWIAHTAHIVAETFTVAVFKDVCLYLIGCSALLGTCSNCSVQFCASELLT